MDGSPRRGWPKSKGFQEVVIAEVDGSRPRLQFGLRSYLSRIVPMTSPQGKDEKIETVDYLEESDFEYPTTRRKGCGWDRACKWCGVPILIAGVIAVLIGQFVPPREPIILRRGSLAYLDKKALTFNSRLELCRIIGLCTLCFGAVMILLSFLISAYGSVATPDYDPVLSPSLTAPHGGIPLSGVLTQVQPISTHSPPKR